MTVFEQCLQDMLNKEIEYRKENHPNEWPWERVRRAARGVIEKLKELLQPMLAEAQKRA